MALTVGERMWRRCTICGRVPLDEADEARHNADHIKAIRRRMLSSKRRRALRLRA